MHAIVNNTSPDDFVVATGESHSVRDFLEIVFTKLQLQYQDFVTQDARFLRPQELPYLRGDSSKIRTQLGWQPDITFEEMVEEMVEFWFARLS